MAAFHNSGIVLALLTVFASSRADECSQFLDTQSICDQLVMNSVALVHNSFYMKADAPVKGVQFTLAGAGTLKVAGGKLEDTGFTVSHGDKDPAKVVSFSLQGAAVDPGCYNMVDFSDLPSATVMSDVVIAGADASAMTVTHDKDIQAKAAKCDKPAPASGSADSDADDICSTLGDDAVGVFGNAIYLKTKSEISTFQLDLSVEPDQKVEINGGLAKDQGFVMPVGNPNDDGVVKIMAYPGGGKNIPPGCASLMQFQSLNSRNKIVGIMMTSATFQPVEITFYDGDVEAIEKEYTQVCAGLKDDQLTITDKRIYVKTTNAIYGVQFDIQGDEALKVVGGKGMELKWDWPLANDGEKTTVMGYSMQGVWIDAGCHLLVDFEKVPTNSFKEDTLIIGGKPVPETSKLQVKYVPYEDVLGLKTEL